MSEIKRGRLGLPEQKYIKDNIKKLGAEQVAQTLNRNVETVREFAMRKGIVFDDHIPSLDEQQVKIVEEFHDTPEWQALEQEFDSGELDYFSHRYAKLMAQFKEDVLPTEETQVFQLIKFELLMNRSLKAAKKGNIDIKRLEAALTSTYAKYKDDDMPDTEKAYASALENQLLSLRAAQTSKSTEFIKLQEKHSSLMKELKATRDQRISKIESSQTDFLSLLKALQEKEFRESAGKQMELVKRSTAKEIQRLGEYHKYADDGVDRPLLSADTIEDEK